MLITLLIIYGSISLLVLLLMIPQLRHCDTLLPIGFCHILGLAILWPITLIAIICWIFNGTH